MDIATLTGACMIGLGTSVAGFYTYRDDMAGELAAATSEAGEKMWRMPLEDSYFDGLKSPVADMKNTGPRYGGAITAALFLKEVISHDKIPWAHIDMAGPVWDDAQGGATGWGARTLAHWAMAQGAKK